MNFPVTVDWFGQHLHPHPLFEGLGYFAGARVYFWQRRRAAQLPLEANLWIILGALIGAFLGSKLLAWAESPHWYFGTGDWHDLLGGKTIVGALLGGWGGVEVAKYFCGVAQSTGDMFVYPLAVGTAIGRLGCFFTGLSDHTYGVATTLPWGVDFGDGVSRHPTQLYESCFVLGLAGVLWLASRRRRFPAGALFRLYLAGYLGWRVLIEFLKPRETVAGSFSAIQLASLAGFALALGSLCRLYHIQRRLDEAG